MFVHNLVFTASCTGEGNKQLKINSLTATCQWHLAGHAAGAVEGNIIAVMGAGRAEVGDLFCALGCLITFCHRKQVDYYLLLIFLCHTWLIDV